MRLNINEHISTNRKIKLSINEVEQKYNSAVTSINSTKLPALLTNSNAKFKAVANLIMLLIIYLISLIVLILYMTHITELHSIIMKC